MDLLFHKSTKLFTNPNRTGRRIHISTTLLTDVHGQSVLAGASLSSLCKFNASTVGWQHGLVDLGEEPVFPCFYETQTYELVIWICFMQAILPKIQLGKGVLLQPLTSVEEPCLRWFTTLYGVKVWVTW